MDINEIWDTIEDHGIQTMVNDVWEDGNIFYISVKTPKTAEFLEQLFQDSNAEVMVSF